jgi:tRNA 5-methylaminomethyl-2-thiouridine biosynthesis bifunctional protein
MSKRFPKLHFKTLHIDDDVSLSTEGFSFDKQHYVICDLDFLSGKNFLAHANAWLRHKSHTQHLYYYALIDSPLTNYDFGDEALGLELKSKWPPILHGMHFIDCADNRIHLVIWFGDRLTGLQELIWLEDLNKDLSLRGWSFDRILIPSAITSSINLLIKQLSHPKTLQIKALDVMPDDVLSKTSKLKNSPWPMAANKPNTSEKKMMIVGAGLAGSYLARIMADDGWVVHLFDAEKNGAQIGSGNAYSVLYPTLSLYDAAITSLTHQAYPYAYSIWREILVQYPELGRCVPLHQASNEVLVVLEEFLSGSSAWFSVDIEKKAIRMHKSLILNMPKVCEYLISHPNIHCHYNDDVDAILYQKELWQIGEMTAPYCVLANGHKVGQFMQTQGMDVMGMRGQMTHIKAIHDEEMIYCAEGHFLPVWNGVHAVGASFQNQFEDLLPCKKDDEKNLKAWKDFFANKGSFEVCGNWVGIRGVTIDHLPIIGPVPKSIEFNETFNQWKHHANLVMDSEMPNYPGLYIFSGFGSKGLVSIPLLAKVLKNIIGNEPLLFSNPLMQSLSPARFSKKRLSKF